MGNRKLNWTAEEEDAFLAAILKHGSVKWKTILRDPEFADQLINRSNVDLKYSPSLLLASLMKKWRNLSGAAGTQGSHSKALPTKFKDEGVTLPAVSAAVTATPPLNADLSSSPAASLPRNIVVDTKKAPRYDGMIFEALSALADENGSDVGSIFHFIETRHEVPPNFRKNLGSRLRRLAAQSKLVKVKNLKSLQNFYKIPDPSGTRTPAPEPRGTNTKPRQSNNQTPQEMIEEAATTAAYEVVEADNKIDLAKAAAEELEKITKLAEKTDLLLELANEMHEQCSRGEVVVLA